MSSRRIAALLAGALLLLPPSLAAQQPEGTALPGRFERQREVRAKIEGLTAAETREWIRHIDRIGEILAANPTVNAPPDGVCTRLRIWVNQYTHARRYPVDEVAVALPVLYNEKGCSQISNTGVKVELNDPLGLLRFDGSINTDNMHDAEGAIAVIARIGTGPGGRPIYGHKGDRLVILTRGTEPLLVPVSRERFLRSRIAAEERALAATAGRDAPPWLDALRDALAELSAAERSAPACADMNSWPMMLGECNDYNQFMALNPRYFDASLPKSALQLIVVRTHDGTSNKENRSHAGVRFRVFETLDYAALEAVLH